MAEKIDCGFPLIKHTDWDAFSYRVLRGSYSAHFSLTQLRNAGKDGRSGIKDFIHTSRSPVRAAIKPSEMERAQSSFTIFIEEMIGSEAITSQSLFSTRKAKSVRENPSSFLPRDIVNHNNISGGERGENATKKWRREKTVGAGDI